MTESITKNIENNKIAFDGTISLLSNSSLKDSKNKHFSNIMGNLNAKTQKMQTNFVDKAVKSNTSSINKKALKTNKNINTLDNKNQNKLLTKEKTPQSYTKDSFAAADSNTKVQNAEVYTKKPTNTVKIENANLQDNTKKQIDVNDTEDNVSDNNIDSFVQTSPVFFKDDIEAASTAKDADSKLLDTAADVIGLILPENTTTEEKIDILANEIISEAGHESNIAAVAETIFSDNDLTKEDKEILNELFKKIDKILNSNKDSEDKNISFEQVRDAIENVLTEKVDISLNSNIYKAEKETNINGKPRNEVFNFDKESEKINNPLYLEKNVEINNNTDKIVENKLKNTFSGEVKTEAKTEANGFTDTILKQSESDNTEVNFETKESLNIVQENETVAYAEGIKADIKKDNFKESVKDSSSLKINELTDNKPVFKETEIENNIQGADFIIKNENESAVQGNINSNAINSTNNEETDEKEINIETSKIKVSVSNENIEKENYNIDFNTAKEQAEETTVAANGEYKNYDIKTSDESEHIILKEENQILSQSFDSNKNDTENEASFNEFEPAIRDFKNRRLEKEEYNVANDIAKVKTKTTVQEENNIKQTEENLEKVASTKEMLEKMMVSLEKTSSSNAGALTVADEITKMALEENGSINFSNMSGHIVYDSIGQGFTIKNNAVGKMAESIFSQLQSKLEQSEILNQITDKLVDLKNSAVQKLTMVLRPNDLGRLSIELLTDKDGLTTNILAQNNDVRAYVEKNIDSLRKQLVDAGINVNNIQIRTAGQEGSTLYNQNENQTSQNLNENNQGQQKSFKENGSNQKNTNKDDREILAGMSNFDYSFSKDFSTVLNKTISYSIN